LRVLEAHGARGSGCAMSPAAQERVGDLTELRVLHAAVLKMPTVHPAWRNLTNLVYVGMKEVEWEWVSRSVARHWQRLETFECDMCYEMAEVPSVLLELPRISSVKLWGATVCDEFSPTDYLGDHFECAGWREHACGMPEWMAQKLQKAVAVSDTSCATSCQRDFEVIQRYNLSPRDRGWSAEEVLLYFTLGGPAEFRYALASDSLSCLLASDENLMNLANVLALVSQVSTCERCSWFQEQESSLAKPPETQVERWPVSCQIAGMVPELRDACDNHKQVTACNGMCPFAMQFFADTDKDGSSTLDTEEMDAYATAGGFPSSGGYWEQCLVEITSCIVNGSLPKVHALLLGTAKYGGTSSCEDC